jgi:hypothetical protein
MGKLPTNHSAVNADSCNGYSAKLTSARKKKIHRENRELEDNKVCAFLPNPDPECLRAVEKKHI